MRIKHWLGRLKRRYICHKLRQKRTAPAWWWALIMTAKEQASTKYIEMDGVNGVGVRWAERNNDGRIVSNGGKIIVQFDSLQAHNRIEVPKVWSISNEFGQHATFPVETEISTTPRLSRSRQGQPAWA